MRNERSPCRQPHGVPAGFTLIEVAVTLTVIAIVAAVALPSMVDFSLGTDAGPLEGVRALLLEAHQAAETTGAEVEVVVVPTSGRYRVTATRPGRDPLVREGRTQLTGVRSRGPNDRFRVVFRPVGMGVGDTLAADGVLLWVDAGAGTIHVLR